MSVDKFNEDIIAVLNQYLGNCTCKHADELKLNILEATADISSVLLSFLQPYILEEKRIQERIKERAESFVKGLKVVIPEAEEEEEEDLTLCPECKKETTQANIVKVNRCNECDDDAYL